VKPGAHLAPIAEALGEISDSLIQITDLLVRINNQLGRFDADLAQIDIEYTDKNGERWAPTAMEYKVDDDDTE
jgi:hypothetical protein